MLATVNSAALYGIDAVPVTVELDLGTGFPSFNIVGLADTAVQEAKERVRAAIRNAGLPFPTNHRILINLAPADTKKSGPLYDLPIAVAILKAHLPLETDLSHALFVGELSLDGAVRPVHGALPIALFARVAGITTLFVPKDNAPEAAYVNDIAVIPVATLGELVKHLTNEVPIAPISRTIPTQETTTYEHDLAHIRGQFFAKRALEIAAAGAHNLLFSGPPGAGKTMLARTLSSILPPMTETEMLEVTKIYSVAGIMPDSGLITTRPFRAPHHSASAISVVGGGDNPKPGEVSFAHRGVLFLDEAPEFPRTLLESLRQPLEDGRVTITRIKHTLTFPARFMLLMSQNPCPCGYFGDPAHQCMCLPMQIQNYQKKLSGPLLDRVDMVLEVPAVKIEELTGETDGEESAAVRARVTEARERQLHRFAAYTKETSAPPLHNNAEMSSEQLRALARIEDAALTLLKTAATQMHLSARAFYRTIKVARTIADLAASDHITAPHIAEALQFREKLHA